MKLRTFKYLNKNLNIWMKTLTKMEAGIEFRFIQMNKLVSKAATTNHFSCQLFISLSAV